MRTMKKKMLLTILAIGTSILIAQAQTSYGNLIQGNAGTGGGGSNSYFGSEAGRISTGFFNTSIGYRTLYDNTTGSSNTAIGTFALFENTTGYRNTATGRSALYYNTSGFYNTATGYGALYRNTTGYYNTANGYGALFNSTTGSRNTANGYLALHSNTTGNGNTATGGGTLYSNTTGLENTANGNLALNNNTTGDFNTATGSVSLYSNTTGYSNTATGVGALHVNTTGSHNTATGSLALYHNTTGSNNTANGPVALYSNTTGYGNTATGAGALELNTTGLENTANGSLVLNRNTTGTYNTANGVGALYHNTTGYGNTAAGYLSGPGSLDTALVNTTAIGSGATPTASNQVRIGNTAVTSIGGYAPWSNLSDGRFKKNVREDIPGLDFINRLRPISYELKHQQLNTFLGVDKKREAVEEMAAASGTALAVPAADVSSVTRRQIGFVAQEVEKVLGEKGYETIGIEVPQNEHDHYSIRYAEFVVPLVKAVQELSVENTMLRQELEALKAVVYGTTPQAGAKETGSATVPASLEGFELLQNVPNPFSQSTTIHAVIPEKVQQAKMVIYNLQGTELESYALTGSGRVSVEISAGQFPAGIYMYGLIADGQLVDTKRMILTK